MTRGKTKTDAHKKAMIEALKKSLGNVTTACKTVGICREQHYKWLKTDEKYKASTEAVADIALDFAESRLFRLVDEGNPTAIIFYLKTKGKKRGYIERQEIDTNQKQVIEIKGDYTKDDFKL